MPERSRFHTIEVTPERGMQLLSPQWVSRLSAGVGNHEGKAALFALMKPGVDYTPSSLYQLMLPQQVNEPWPSLKTTISGWFEDSFVPYGFISKIPGSRIETHYRKDESGVGALGEAWAGWMLSYSETHPRVSLYQLLGSRILPEQQGTTAEHLTGAPLRIRLLYELSKLTGTITRNELAKRLEDDTFSRDDIEITLRSHLNSLQASGVISYERRRKGETYSYFQLSDTIPSEDPPPIPKREKIFGQIYGLLSSRRDIFTQPFGYETIYEALIAEYPEMENYVKKGVVARISLVMNHLLRNGYVNQVGFSRQEQTRISVPAEIHQDLVDLIVIIDHFRELDPQFLEQGRQQARDIAASPLRFSALLRKAKENSPRAKQEEYEEEMIPQWSQMTREERIPLLLAQVRQFATLGIPLTFFGISDIDEELARFIHQDIGFSSLERLLQAGEVEETPPRELKVYAKTSATEIPAGLNIPKELEWNPQRRRFEKRLPQVIRNLQNVIEADMANENSADAESVPLLARRGQVFLASWVSAIANCIGHDTNELYVVGSAQNERKKICKDCPVQALCLATELEIALTRFDRTSDITSTPDGRLVKTNKKDVAANTQFGIWGGRTQRERRAMISADDDELSNIRKFLEEVTKATIYQAQVMSRLEY